MAWMHWNSLGKACLQQAKVLFFLYGYNINNNYSLIRKHNLSPSAIYEHQWINEWTNSELENY